jgi:hypothetical protein
MRSLIDMSLIAPCGMNCSICKMYLRPNTPCRGCNDADQNKPKTRAQCRLRICDKRKGYFCYDCAEFPCALLKRMDTRYRNRYGMSEIINLEYIRDNGIKKFLENERERWICKRASSAYMIENIINGAVIQRLARDALSQQPRRI